MPPVPVDPDERPFVLIWELTQACALACKHCRADAQPNRHPDELSTEEGKALLEDIRSFGENQLLVLSGGDPLHRDDALALIEYGLDIGLQVTLTPSGTSSLRRSDIQELGDMGIRRLALSLDGATASSHDDFRQETGSFDRTMEAARTARDIEIPLQINTTVCAETVDELPALVELIEELNIVLWSVFFLVPVGRGQVLDPVSPQRAEDVMTWLAKQHERRSFGIKTTEAPHFRRVMLQSLRDVNSVSSKHDDGIGRRSGIGAGNGFAFISHTGDVYPSGFLPQSVGNVKDCSIVDLYRNAPLFRQLRDPDRLHGKCGACEFRQVCGGSRSRAWAVSGDPLASDPLCPYIPEGYAGELPPTLTTSG